MQETEDVFPQIMRTHLFVHEFKDFVVTPIRTSSLFFCVHAQVQQPPTFLWWGKGSTRFTSQHRSKERRKTRTITSVIGSRIRVKRIHGINSQQNYTTYRERIMIFQKMTTHHSLFTIHYSLIHVPPEHLMVCIV
jgi:hypothetical protein